MPQEAASHRCKHAVIAGAGPGGLTAAIALRRAGFAVTICDAVDVLKPAGSGLTLWPNALRALHHIGLSDDVVAIGAQISSVVMRNWRDQLIFADTVPGDGHFPAVALTRTALVGALACAAEGANVERAALEDFAVRRDVVAVQLDDGRELTCDLLVGADGLHSTVRARLFGKNELSYGGYVVTRGIADRNLAGDAGTIWMGPARLFGVFPLPDERTYWFASEKRTEAEKAQPRPAAALRESFAGWPSPVTAAIVATAGDRLLCNDICDLRPLKTWSSGRVTLLGDAAHPAAPTLGQGGCQAIEDAITLGWCGSREHDIASALRGYERRRIGRATSFVREARMMGRLGLWQNPLSLAIRDAMMRAMPASYRQAQLARTFDFRI